MIRYQNMINVSYWINVDQLEIISTDLIDNQNLKKGNIRMDYYGLDDGKYNWLYFIF